MDFRTTSCAVGRISAQQIGSKVAVAGTSARVPSCVLAPRYLASSLIHQSEFIPSHLTLGRNGFVWGLLLLRFGGDVDHPMDAELVGEHSEGVTPELLGKRHVSSATFRKLGEDFREFVVVLTAYAH